jgi:DME family drug/metabolite transporter
MARLNAMRARFGPLMVGTASVLWATDALFRFPTVGAIDPVFIVLSEHLIGSLILAPFLALKDGAGLWKLTPRQWTALGLIGAGGSALATVLFTASFVHVNPSVAILLQKLQPVLVVLLSWAFLGERPGRSFALWASVALLAALWLSFPDLDFGFLRGRLDFRSQGVLYAGGSALLWAVSTVLGKAVLQGVSPSIATFWRFCFGLVTLATLQLASGSRVPLEALHDTRILEALLYMAVVPGVVAMLAYYEGLKRTPASVTTFIELIFPVGAVALNTIFLHTTLEPVQLAAGGILLFAVTMLSRG